MKEMQDKIVKLLEGYTFREKKIALLRHEWYHPNQVTPEEMLEAMAYSRNTDGGAPVCGHISDKTYHIALNYEDQAARQNREQIETISTDLERLERVQYRLGYCVSAPQAAVNDHTGIIYQGKGAERYHSGTRPE